ncbi:MAG: RNA polymerase sigma factor [Candidatus Kapaibacterium sp.]
MERVLDIYRREEDLIRDYTETRSERAASYLVQKFRNFVYSTALRYLQNHEDADDAAQEAFIKALDNLHKFKRGSSLKTWLYRITVNVSINSLRKRKLKKFITGRDEIDPDMFAGQFSADSGVMEDDFNARFMKALSELPEKQRETFALRYFDDLPYKEISGLLGTSESGLKANYHQAVKKLAIILKDNQDGEL